MSSQRVSIAILVICAASVFGKPLSIDVFENKDILLSKKSDLVKRTTAIEHNDDVAELSKPSISLSAFIDNLESSLLQTALSAGSVANNPSVQVEQITPAPAEPAVVKRSVTEVKDEPIVLVQTTENVSAAEAVPAHVVIDRVTVFKAPLAGAALLPTFHFHEAPAIEVVKSADVDVEEDTFVVETSISPKVDDSSESSEESTEVPSSSPAPPSSTTPEDEKKVAEKELKEKMGETTEVPSSSPAPPSSTTPEDEKKAAEKELKEKIEKTTEVPSSSPAPPSSTTPEDEKKAAEEELKEKIAEVEADPVILTARV